VDQQKDKKFLDKLQDKMKEMTEEEIQTFHRRDAHVAKGII